MGTNIAYNINNTVTSSDIKECRKRLGLTQSQFAKMLGVSRPTAERMENGDKEVTGPVALLVNMINDDSTFIETYRIPDRTTPLRLWYMYKNRRCALIDVDENNRKVTVRNYASNIMYLPFGANKMPSFEDFEDFLKSRCFPETRDKIKIQLDALGIPFYDPMLIIEKTKGRMAEDDFWIEIER